jgi:hypothetical protein
MPLERRIRQGVFGPGSGAMGASVLALALTSACGNAQSGAPPNTAAETRPGQQEPNEYPVNWPPTLLNFMPQAPADNQQSTLEAMLGQDWEDAFQLTNGLRTVEARSCRALLGLDGTYETVVPSDFNVYKDREAQCQAAALLVRAKPSKTSFLHGFVLDERAPNRLPAALAFTVSPEDDQRVSQASAQGKPWGAVEDVRLLEQASAAEARFGANASEQNLIILGLGDVNRDGFEDLLLLSRGRLTEGSLKSTRLLLLTQESAKEPTMRLLPLILGKREPG